MEAMLEDATVDVRKRYRLSGGGSKPENLAEEQETCDYVRNERKHKR